MLIKDVKKFLKNAVYITCAVASLTQSVGSAFADVSPPASSNAQIQLSDAGNLSTFDATSMRGDSVVFLSSDSPIAQELFPGFSAEPRAAYLASEEGDVTCMVSESPGMAANLGNRIIQVDSAEHGAVVEASLTRLTTAAHEYGHCLDMLSSQDIIQGANNAGITPYDVPTVAIDQAVKNGTGVIDVDWVADTTPSDAQEALDSSQGNALVGIAMLEVYADLQGTLQTAATTGDLRGFYEFQLSIRMNNTSSLGHTTSLAVSNILSAEQEAGLDPESLKGASYDTINSHVNRIFLKHFSVDGQLSIDSDGFKDIVKEFQIKKQIGLDVPEDLSASVDALADATNATVTDDDKKAYLELMGLSIDHQKNLAANANEGRVAASGLSDMFDRMDGAFDNARDALGVTPSADSTIDFERSDVGNAEIQDAALDFYTKATTSSGSLDQNYASIGDLLKSPEKKYDHGLEP